MIILDRQFLFIIAIPLWMIYRVFNHIIKRKRKIELNLRRELLINCFFIYYLAVACITFFPLFIGNDGIPGRYISINYIPVINTLNELGKIHQSYNSNFMLKFWLKNIGGNLVMLLPIGVMVPLLWNKFRNFKTVVMIGFIISFAIETLQLLSVLIGNRGRAFDVDDLMLNTAGVVFGYVIYVLFDKFIKKRSGTIESL